MSAADEATPFEDQGLIGAWWFEPGGAARPLASMAQAQALLAEGSPGFAWLHVNLSHARAESRLRALGRLSEDFFEALSDGSRSTRLERDGAALFGVINDVAFDFQFDAQDVSTLWVSVSEQLVVSARRHPLRSVDRLRTAIKRGELVASSVRLLDHLLRDQADELQRITRLAAERIDDIEDEVLAGHHQRHAAELARLRRVMVRLQRLLAPEPSALMRTLSQPPAWLTADDVQRLRSASEEFAVTLRDLAVLQERVKLMQDEAAARVAEQNNRSLYMLTMVTVLALPINLTAGLFGMNVGGIPLAEHKGGFWIVLGLIGLLTAWLGWFTVSRLKPAGE